MDLKNCRVVVTGGSGFLGKHVVKKLENSGARVFVSRKKDYDLVFPGTAEELLAAQRPDVVIHLAARVGGIGANRANPGTFFYENLMMGVQLLEACRIWDVRKVVTVGTVCAYPRDTQVPFKEDDLWSGYPEETNAPYGLAKKMLLVQAQAYRKQYGMNAIHLVPVNLYGPGDNFDSASSHVIPALIRKVDEAKSARRSFIEIWGTGTASREFLHVQDAARGIVLATAHYDGLEPVNLGSGQELYIRELVNVICDAMHYTGEVRWDTSKPDGQPRRSLDTSRAKREFGFAACTPFAVGIHETVAWYLEHKST